MATSTQEQKGGEGRSGGAGRRAGENLPGTPVAETPRERERESERKSERSLLPAQPLPMQFPIKTIDSAVALGTEKRIALNPRHAAVTVQALPIPEL